MLYLLHLILAAASFLAVLNSFLRGARTRQLGIGVGVLLLGAIGGMFVGFGFWAGMVGLGFGFSYRLLFQPLAARVAARLFRLDGRPGGVHVGLPTAALTHISKELGRQQTNEELLAELRGKTSRGATAKAALIELCLADPTQKATLQEFGASREALAMLFDKLWAEGAGQWRGGHLVAASALVYPHTLRFLLQHRTGGLSNAAQVHALLTYFERGAPLP